MFPGSGGIQSWTAVTVPSSERYDGTDSQVALTHMSLSGQTASADVQVENAPAKEINLRLTIKPEVLADRGDGEPWRHSRLRWLDSTIQSAVSRPSMVLCAYADGA